MLRLLGTRRWITWLCVAAAWASLCVVAGRWQWHRWQDKSTIQSRMDRNYDAAPLAVDTALRDGTAPPKSEEWRQVVGKGHYVGPTLLVRNRPGPGGDFGYEVLDVLQVGAVQVLVDRGWIANGANAATPSSVPHSPTGEVTMTGWVRLSERDLKRAAIAGQLSSISVAEAERATHRNLVDGYVTMRSEKLADGTSPQRPKAQDKPSQGMAAGINLSYALQWWLGAIAGFAFVLLRARREHLDSLAVDEELHEMAQGDPSDAPASDATVPAGSTPLTQQADAAHPGPVPTNPAPTKPARTKRAKAPKQRKTRIWDEEDE